MDKREKPDAKHIIKALSESVITPAALLEELLPLIDDYFLGDFKFGDGGIIFNFMNGQSFILKIEETNFPWEAIDRGGER